MDVCAVYEFGSKVRPITIGCVVMSSAGLFNLRSILFLHSAECKLFCLGLV